MGKAEDEGILVCRLHYGVDQLQSPFRCRPAAILHMTRSTIKYNLIVKVGKMTNKYKAHREAGNMRNNRDREEMSGEVTNGGDREWGTIGNADVRGMSGRAAVSK